VRKVTDSLNILARWRKLFSLLLDVHWCINDRQTEIHTRKPLVPQPSAFNVERAIDKIKRHKFPGVDQIQTEFF
jgi:hypothetical protein